MPTSTISHVGFYERQTQIMVGWLLRVSQRRVSYRLLVLGRALMYEKHVFCLCASYRSVTVNVYVSAR